MKTFLLLIVVFISVSQIYPEEPKIKLIAEPEQAQTKTTIEQKIDDDERSYKDGQTFLLLNYGYSKVLRGYTDDLYVGQDKSDYFYTNNHNAFFEFSQLMSVNFDSLNKIIGSRVNPEVGFNLGAYVIPESATVNIPAGKAPVNSHGVNQKIDDEQIYTIGFFLGGASKLKSIEIGATFAINLKKEEKRERRILDGNGNPVLNTNGTPATEFDPGRGYFATLFILPNFRFRYGDPDQLNITFDILRGHVNLVNDWFNYYIHIPIMKYFELEIGNGLFPYATLFIRPILRIGNFRFSVKGGMDLNFYQNNLERVGIQDTFYGDIGMDFHF